LAFIEIVDKSTEKEKKKVEKDSVQYRERPSGLNIVLGQNCYIPLEAQLFEDERIALKAAKQFPVSKHFSDEYIMASLFARKLDLKRTEEFLNSSFSWRKQRGFLKIPKLSEIDHRLFDVSFYLPGSRDKLGRSVRYLNINRVIPNTGPFMAAEMTKWEVWLHYVGFFCDGMDGLRNGCCLVAQLDGYGWKHFDVDFQRQMAPIWVDTFPVLVRKMLMLNPPSIISAILKITTMFMKEKMMDRIEQVDVKEITKIVEPQFLVKEFGGDVEWGPKNYVALLKEWAEKNEERLIAPGRDAV